MDRDGDRNWEHRFRRVLGDELWRARRARGWTRRDLANRLTRDVSPQALATYELGTRRLSVEHLAEITEALGVPGFTVLERTYERVFGDDESAVAWIVDLAAASRLDDPRLTPLRRWAAVRVGAHDGPQIARLTMSAVASLAVLCGMDARDLVARLPRPHMVVASRR